MKQANNQVLTSQLSVYFAHSLKYCTMKSDNNIKFWFKK